MLSAEVADVPSTLILFQTHALDAAETLYTDVIIYRLWNGDSSLLMFIKVNWLALGYKSCILNYLFR